MSNLNEIIDSLLLKYQDNEYVKNKLVNYINNLPILLNNLDEEYQKKTIVKETLNKNKDLFIATFLSNNLFFIFLKPIFLSHMIIIIIKQYLKMILYILSLAQLIKMNHFTTMEV